MKYSGKIGFVKSVEETITVSGVTKGTGKYVKSVFEKHKTGEVIQSSIQSTGNDRVNGDVELSNKISFVGSSDDFASFQYIKYAEFLGSMWCVTNVTIQYPRLVLTLGGVYNGKQA